MLHWKITGLQELQMMRLIGGLTTTVWCSFCLPSVRSFFSVSSYCTGYLQFVTETISIRVLRECQCSWDVVVPVMQSAAILTYCNCRSFLRIDVFPASCWMFCNLVAGFLSVFDLIMFDTYLSKIKNYDCWECMHTVFNDL